MHSSGKIYEKLIFLKTVEALVIILTWYVKGNILALLIFILIKNKFLINY